MEIGTTENAALMFTYACLLMAKESSYQTTPVSRLPELFDAILEKRYRVLIQDGEPLAIVIWQRISLGSAKAACDQQKMPGKGDVEPQGQAIAFTALIGSNGTAVSRLVRHVFKEFSKTPILYERHQQGRDGRLINKFKCVHAAHL